MAFSNNTETIENLNVYLRLIINFPTTQPDPQQQQATPQQPKQELRLLQVWDRVHVRYHNFPLTNYQARTSTSTACASKPLATWVWGQLGQERQTKHCTKLATWVRLGQLGQLPVMSNLVSYSSTSPDTISTAPTLCHKQMVGWLVGRSVCGCGVLWG